MIMSVDASPPDPQCVLHGERLKNIDEAVNSTKIAVEELQHQLVSAEGYIPRIHTRLSLVETATERAHERIDDQSSIIKEVKRSHTSLAIKVASAVAVLAIIAEIILTRLT